MDDGISITVLTTGDGPSDVVMVDAVDAAVDAAGDAAGLLILILLAKRDDDDAKPPPPHEEEEDVPVVVGAGAGTPKESGAMLCVGRRCVCLLTS